jgi:hypothetical protein
MPTKPATESGFKIDWLDEVDDTSPTSWAWQDWIPLGMPSALFGVPKIGKGLICANIASRLTLGTLPGDLYGKPSNVMMAWSEDASMLIPRILAASGDPSRVGRVPRFTITERERDIGHLEMLIAESETKLLVIDHLLDYLPSGIDLWKDEVREPLGQLTQLANNTGAAILMVLHESSRAKASGKRIMNATAFTAVPRVILNAEKTKDGRRLKKLPSNVGGYPEPLQYETKVVELDGHQEESGTMVKVEWLSDLMATPSPSTAMQNGSNPAGQAKDFLRRVLSPVPQERSEIVSRAAREGFSESAVKRAADELQVTRDRVGFPSKTVWSLR